MADRDPETGQFVLGHTGSGGRPVGARNRLGGAFIEAMEADFNTHGVKAIEQVRQDRPHEYLKIIAGLLPKEFTFKDATLDDMTDDELISILGSVRSLVAAKSGQEDSGNLAEAPTSGTAH